LLPATAAASCEKIDEMFSSSTIFSSRRAMSHHDIFLVSSFSSSRERILHLLDLLRGAELALERGLAKARHGG